MKAYLAASFVLQSIIVITALLYRSDSHVQASQDPAHMAKELSDRLNSKSGDIHDELEIIETDEQFQEDTGPQEVKYKVEAGDTLSRIWSKITDNASGGIKAADAFKKAGVPINSLRLGEEILLKVSTDKEIVEFSMKLPEGKSVTLSGDSVSGYEANVNVPEIVERERTVSYPIFSSFSASATEVNVPLDIVDDLVDLFSGRIDFRRDIQPGDTFTVIYNERSTADGTRLAPGHIKAISIETGGKLVVAIGHTGSDGKVRYFNESGEQIGNNYLRYPLRFSRISSIFTKSRFHPILKVSRPHNGVDFAAPTGTPVRSIGDGVVEQIGYGKGSGNMIKIKHTERYSTAYMHLSKFAPFLKKGTRVSKGQVIGNVGSTGMSTAPHLHFSMYKDNVFIDPMTANLPVVASKENAIPKAILASTLTTLRQQHELVRLASNFARMKSA